MKLPLIDTDELTYSIWEDWFSRIPEPWDDDIAAEAILGRYIHHLEDVIQGAGLCLYLECHWDWDEPCDHGYLPQEILP